MAESFCGMMPPPRFVEPEKEIDAMDTPKSYQVATPHIARAFEADDVVEPVRFDGVGAEPAADTVAVLREAARVREAVREWMT